MNEYLQTAEAAPAAGARAAPEPDQVDPRQVAALVVAQTGVVNAKKDELSSAIKALTDMGHQLARAYVGQMQTTQELAQRVKALEATAGGPGTDRAAAGG
jgi:hypothetical protein